MPSNKFYVVSEDAVTGELSALDESTTKKKVQIIEVAPDNISEADGIVANYTQDDYVASTTVTGVSGQTSSIILLPEGVVG